LLRRYNMIIAWKLTTANIDVTGNKEKPCPCSRFSSGNTRNSQFGGYLGVKNSTYEMLDELDKLWYHVGSYPPFARACPAPAGHALL